MPAELEDYAFQVIEHSLSCEADKAAIRKIYGVD